MEKPISPKLSIIVTTFNDGPIIEHTIQSILRQTEPSFQLIIVDDGSTDATPEHVSKFDDPRILFIQQFNDGLSGARNKGLEQVTGEYVCFLDADDIRPAWAFKAISRVLDKGKPDVVFCRGVLSEIRDELFPFYDSHVFNSIEHQLGGDTTVSVADPRYDGMAAHLFALEPQSANKVVRTAFLKEKKLGFPNTHFFEDMLFHTLCIMHAKTIGFVQDPCFTYFRRYYKQQITANSNDIRMDAVPVGKVTLDLFSRAPAFDHPHIRTALFLSVLKMLRWCEHSISHHYRYGYQQIVKAVLAELPARYMAFSTDVLEWYPHSRALVDYATAYRKEVAHG